MAVDRWWSKARGWHGGNRPAPALAASALLAAPGFLTGSWYPGVLALLIGPLLACVHLDTRRTAAVAAWSLLLALAAGTARQRATTPGFAVEFLILLAGSALAVHSAGRRTAAEHALARAERVARESQQAILRPVSARLGGVDVCTRHHCPVPGASVGGDLYDIAHTPFGVRLLIGDVRGHSLAALGTTAAAIRAFRDLAYLTPGLADLATAMDARLSPGLGPEDFVTAVLAEFAPGEVRLVNCGHPPPVRVGKRVRLLEPPEPALPLGLHPTPRQHRVYLQSDDRLLFYTDGLSEARAADGTDFALLERVGEALSEPSPADALDVLHGMVTAHTGGPPTDDLALILCQSANATALAPIS
ncbi:PP2C family protein-serine/threonine phosphatase [Streptomyces sp. NPDC050617]|uniref:PP2C family protein-serine/threonine phosphatase n=1 Tax=Streptomyces sp. NPDC050617 TaxID=3154628 RepID=UPI0034308888